MQTNFLVIGSGIAGLNFALNAAKKGKVILITKKNLIDSATNYAQGGIAAVLDRTDNLAEFIDDTLKAGGHHNLKSAVRFLAKNSAKAIYHLIDLGVEFAKESGKLKLTKEGGHSKNRIVYSGDYTGKEIENVLVKRVREHLNIEIFENTFALKLIKKGKSCLGAEVLVKNKKISKLKAIYADQTILATGGLGQLYPNTTNPKISTGDGFAMGIKIGCKMTDLEFIQFHPTALAKRQNPRFLISETVRGEGGILLNHLGQKFMQNLHPQKDLAPRDIVARRIYHELQKGPVYVDIRHKDKQFLKQRFPKIYQKLEAFGLKMEKDLIPVTPAAHYICGGIVTDLSGRTNIKNLFAFGEVARTGVHGANRLASNSLLEALVFSDQIIKKLKKSAQKKSQEDLPKLKIIPETSPETLLAKKLQQEIKKLMWEYAGIIRDTDRIIEIGIPKIKIIIAKLEDIQGCNQKIAETRNMADLALAVLKAASKRKKTLGCHIVA